MPLFAGEFCSPDDTLSSTLQDIGMNGAWPSAIPKGGYAMMRGPYFEGRLYDKKALAMTGASIVGMSTLPEACIAALYGAKVLAVAFITNDAVEEHSHAINMERAGAASAGLGAYLESVIARM